MVHLQPHYSTLAFTSAEVENVAWKARHAWQELFVPMIIIESPELDSILQGCFATYKDLRNGMDHAESLMQDVWTSEGS